MDATLFHAVNALAGRYDAIDDVVESISQFAPFALIALLLGLWFWPGGRVQRDDRQWTAIAAMGAATLALAVNEVVIRLWQRPRPFAAHRAVMLLRPSHDPSFPSDHATFGFAIAVGIVLGARRIGVAALLVAALLAFSRVYAGEHYPGDVVAGAIIGATCAVVVSRLRTAVSPWIDGALRLARRVRLA